MRLWGCIPFFASLPLAFTAQVIFQQDINVLSQNIIDALSSDPEFTSILRLVQRAKLVPTLNKLNGSTFFAPTNDAVSRHASDNPMWKSVLDDDTHELRDNIQEKLRQELFYHLLNHTLPTDVSREAPETLFTLHYPNTSIEPPTNEPPPYPPWMPIPGGTLGGKPQRLRIVAKDDDQRVGVDSSGKNGVKIKERKDVSNGAVLKINDVLAVPSDIATVISNHPALSYLRDVLTLELIQFLNSTSELTVFLPVNEAWAALPFYERLYLESKYATDDLTRIVNLHAVMSKKVHYSDSFDSGLNLTTVEGQELQITKTEEGKKTNVSSAQLIEPDIYASNGVIHTVSSLLIPPGALQLTPEKYLLVLNCTSFVDLLHSVDLTSLINDTETHWTILAPQDDVIALFGNGDLPPRGSEELKKMLQYHFIPGKQSPKKLRDSMLLETALKEEGLDGGRQVLSVDVHEEDSKDKKKGKDKSIRFGGASTIGEPVEVNNTLIYFISRPLVPPADALTTSLPQLELSTYLAAVFSTNLADKFKYTPRTTLLIPRNVAFKRLGMLVSAHLLSASSKSDLEKVIQHHVIKGVEYAEHLQNGTQRTYGTLEGSDLHVDRKHSDDNDTVILTASGGWSDMHSLLYPKDYLTQTGVIHEVSDVMIPRTVDLTIGKLMTAAKASTMATMMTKAGLEWIMNGTNPPDGTRWADEGLKGVGWTLLCPTDDAFKGLNLTALYADKDKLTDIVLQHLIPTQQPSKAPSNIDFFEIVNNNRPLVLDDSMTYSTLLSAITPSLTASIVFRDIEGEGTVVGIQGARGADGKNDWAHVTSWGRSTTGRGTGGVLQIDRLLMPYHPSMWMQYGGPVAVLTGGILLICAFFYGVRVIWKRDATEATYEPVGGFSHDDDEASPLPPTPSLQIPCAMTDTQTPEEPKAATNSTAESIKSFLSGGAGGVAAVLVGHPFDLTKTRLQTAPPGTYTGAIDVVKKALARDGATGLYRGVVPPLLGVTPIFAISFWAYDMSKSLIYAATPNRTSKELSVAEYAAAGFLSAVPTTLVTAPVERAKVLLQVQGQVPGGQHYTGVFDVVKHLYREGGIRSVFRGAGATVARDGPGSAAYFAAYEVTKGMLTTKGSSDLNLGAVIFAGGMAGVAMWSIAIPPDVIKSRIQSAPTGTYSGFLDCARKTIAADGVSALWRGLGPAMARAFPANAATFLGVEATKKLLDSYL
ncbi:hypothetical protein BDW22DRAFT_1480314 [Trametopsis cervina]|nr:hypothetical protein BDW22DRAFT_1480314 [Trametopsis cervina]